jgi:hypothetical protein
MDRGRGRVSVRARPLDKEDRVRGGLGLGRERCEVGPGAEARGKSNGGRIGVGWVPTL